MNFVPSFRTPIVLNLLLILAAGPVLLCGCNSRGGAANAPARKLTALAAVEQEGEAVVDLSFASSDVTDEELAQLSQYKQLKSLTLQECKKVTDDGLKPLAHLDNLKKLQIIHTPITDDGLKYVGQTNELEELMLAHTQVKGEGLRRLAGGQLLRLDFRTHHATPDGLSHLIHLTTLRDLYLDCPNIKISQLPSLDPLKKLESLNLGTTLVGKAGAAKLKGLTSLQTFIIDGRGVGDEIFAALNEMKNLREADLFTAEITNQGLKAFHHETLERLSLCGCMNITDAGLANLSGLTNLQYLNLTESGVQGKDLTGLGEVSTLKKVEMSANQFRGDAASIEALKKLGPQCEVVVIQS